MPERIINNPRYSFIVLVTLSLVVGFIATMVSLKAIHDDNRGWCQVITSITAIPAEKPANPVINPAQERSWEIYLKLLERGRTLGCY